MNKLESLISDANKTKWQLFRLQTQLLENGFDGKAKKLDKIIGLLEAWQNDCDAAARRDKMPTQTKEPK